MLKASLLRLSESTTAQRIVTGAPISRHMVRRFVAGSTLAEAIDAARELNSAGLKVSLDYLGESVESREEAEAATRMAIDTLTEIQSAAIDGNISIKPSQMGLDIDADFCRANLTRILEHAASLHEDEGEIFVRLDMESSDYVEPTIRLLEGLWADGFRNVGTVVQSYLFRTPDDILRLNELGCRVRLVKGAYKEPEEVAYQEKAVVDEMFVREMEMLLEGGNYPAIATHDEAMIDATRRYAFEHGVGKERFEFQMLYGIRRDFQARLHEEGYTVRVYVPFGDAWYPYLMRRLAERPANLAFMVRSVVSESPLRRIASPFAIGAGMVTGTLAALGLRKRDSR